MRTGIFAFIVFSIAVHAADADLFYKAIRNDDLSTLKSLVKASGPDVADQRGTMPLMLAAAYGSTDAMRLLLNAGAAVNAKNSFDATALMWCAADLAKVRLLLDNGADVNAKTKNGRTPLLIAAGTVGNSEVVRLLLDKGANLKAATADPVTSPLTAAAGANDIALMKLLLERGEQVQGLTGAVALMGAAALGNTAMVRMLLAKGVDVNFTSPPQLAPPVKNGPIQLGLFTPLLVAVTYGGAETVGVLLEAGAKVNVQDVRGMTPLMLALASDRPDPKVVRLLLDRGADPQIKSKVGENALDWARKYNSPAILKELKLVPVSLSASIQPKAAELRPAIERSLALLQRSAGSFFNEGGCAACHSHNLTALAIDTARKAGFHADPAVIMNISKQSSFYWTTQEQLLLQRIDGPGAPDLVIFGSFQYAAEKMPADRSTDAMLHNMAAMQQTNGNWTVSGGSRAPLEDGDFARTALALKALQLYGAPGRKAEFDRRIQQAAAWLENAAPLSTEDRNMQLLGLKWASRPTVAQRLNAILASQNSDGGWSQTPYLASDAYATGQTLYVLHEAGVAAASPGYRKAVDFLLRTQLADGSWHVVSRAPKFQPYFQSGFPHDHDQWISMAGTSWATVGLSYAAMEQPRAVARN